MPNLTARDMLARLPVRMAVGGEARAFSDDEVRQFIEGAYAQYGGPGVEAHRAIADAMAQYGVGVNQVARVTGYSPREVEAEFMGQRAGERPVLDDPTGTAAGMSAAYRAAAQAGGQQTVDDYYANLRADAAAYLANPNAPTGVDAYNMLIESGISTSDLINAGVANEVLNKIFTVSKPFEQSQFVTPAGLASAYERSPDLAYESQRLTALGQDGRGILDAQGRDYIANLMADGIIDDAERAQMLEYATERGYTFDDLLKAGVDPNVLFRQRPVEQPALPAPALPAPAPALPAPPVAPFPEPAPYTPPTVYQPLPTQPDIYAPGEVALDQAFRDSPPRTEIPEMPGQFEYTPAASLRPATGAGYSWTPPSVTSRPRSLLSPLAIQGYGGLQSASQRFAQDRARMNTLLRSRLDASPALRTSSAYNMLRNRLMSGEFGQNFENVFNPQTEEGQRFERLLRDIEARSAPMGGATTGTMADFAGAMGTGGYGSPVVPIDLRYGPVGGQYALFSQGGAVKKSDGSAKDELARFADGGEARRPLSPDDPLYIHQDDVISNDNQIPLDELLRQQLGLIDETSSVRAPQEDPQSESRSMLERLKGVGSAANQLFYDKISAPAVGAAVDMTVGLGDLAQMGARYLGERAGMDTGEFSPVAPRVKEALGVGEYDPYAPGALPTYVLPFAASPSAIARGASFAKAFPHTGRESAAVLGAETAVAAAEKAFPDSTWAQILAAFGGGMGGGWAMTDPVRRVDASGTGSAERGSAASMLDKVVDASDTSPVRLRRVETQAIDNAVTNRNRRRNLKTEARRIKSNYLQEDGWAPIEVSGVEKGKPKFKKISYGFQKPPSGIDSVSWSNQLSDGLVSEVNNIVDRARSGDQAAINILEQANWYRSMRDQLRSEFGGIGDVFADVLGTTSAQTNVEQNFRNATEILRRYSRGEFDAELQAYENRIKQGLPVDGRTLTALHNAGEFPLITNSAGKLFNTNSPSSMGALLDMFRSVKTGSAPKTPNFTGNLIGLTNEATIDVWAARMLRRLSGQSRIPPVAEQGVTGTHLVGSSLENPRVGGEFGFGQEVFRNAAERINASGNVKSIVPEMGDLGPDDLQAVAWFMEKERWTRNGWTTKAGEGGSLDYEMSLAGSPEQSRIDNLRREINTGFKAPRKRKKETDEQYAVRLAQARNNFEDNKNLMQAELASLEAPLQRYVLGVSGERPSRPMSGYGQAELASEFDDVVRNDNSVLSYNLANTYGSFMGDTERALNAEFVVQQNFNPNALVQRLIEQGKAYDQDAVFISRTVSADSPNARPGVEIYFKDSVTPEQMAKLTQKLREKGIDGFTYVTDMRFGDRINRQTRSGDPETASLTGLRFQYVPEFDELFDPSKADEIYARQADLYRGVVSDIISDGNVSDVRLNYYDTQVYFRDQYDDYLATAARERSSGTRGELSSGANDSQSNRGRERPAELSEPVRDRIGQANGTNAQNGINNFAKGGSVTSSRRMLDTVIGKRVDATGPQRFAEGGEVTSSRRMLERLSGVARGANQAFYENISKPAVGTAIDMTLGLGDLAQMGARYVGGRMGREPGEFRSVAQPVKEALGFEDYNPYTYGGVGAAILPFAAAGRTAQSVTSIPTAASQLRNLFPNIGRETAAYTGAEAGAAAARKFVPDSTAAELLASVVGGVGGSALGSPPTSMGIIKEKGGVDMIRQPRGVAEAVPTAARQMLDEVAPPAARLDMSQEARLARAAEQGYTPTLYHGTANLDNATFDEFNKKFYGSATNSPSAKLGTWLTDDPKTANIYASFAPFSLLQGLEDKYANALQKLFRTTSTLQKEERIAAREKGKLKLAPLADKIKQATEALEAGVPDPAEARKFFPLPTRIGGGGGANIMPVRARGNFMEYDAGDTSIRELQDKKGLTKLGKEAKEAGYDGLKITNFRDPITAPAATHYLVFDPKNIRSVNADFDPKKLDSANLGYAKGGTVTKKPRAM